MADAADDLRDLLIRPTESLAIELKPWLDLKTPHGKEKIIKARIALRNNDGGRLIIGFENDGTPCKKNIPPDARKSYDPDAIQTIVTKFASEPFAVDVTFVEKDGLTYPIVTVSPGVQVPVAAKSDLPAPDNTPLVRRNTVYVRTLSHNGTYSSAEATPADWSRLAGICFDNREADIGRFIRRHLAALDLNSLAALVPAFAQMLHQPTDEELVIQELNRCRARFEAACKDRPVKVPDIGYRESVALVQGEVEERPLTYEFRRQLLNSGARHSGWQPWVDLSPGGESPNSPYVLDNGWEALVAFLPPHPSIVGYSLDFWRIERCGLFYHIRGLEDDLTAHPGLTPGTELDFVLQISRVAEVISNCLAYTRSLARNLDTAAVTFGFRWTKLKGRKLSCWVDPYRDRFLRTFQAARQDTYQSLPIAVPLETPPAGIPPHVEKVVRGLFSLFGNQFSGDVIEQIALETLRQRF